MTSSLVLVTAATGRQGGAAVRALQAAGHGVRAAVRHPGSPQAEALAQSGAEVMAADLDDRDALAAALRGVEAAFLYLNGYMSPELTTGLGPDDERRRGVRFIDLAVAAGVRHLVYSSALSVDRPDTSPLLRPKAAIEDHLRRQGPPATILRPVGFMENYTGPMRGLRPDGVLASMAPPDVPEQLIAARDIGRFVAHVIGRPDTYVRAELDIAGDELTAPAVAERIERATGRRVRYEQIDPAPLREQDPKRAAAIESMYAEGRPQADLATLSALDPPPLTFEAWLGTEDATGLQEFLRDAPRTATAD